MVTAVVTVVVVVVTVDVAAVAAGAPNSINEPFTLDDAAPNSGAPDE